MSDDEVRARVVEIEGQIYLDDPVARAVIEVVERENRKRRFEMHRERILYFAKRIEERGDDPNTLTIVILNVDSQLGGPMAEVLMPGFDWQPIRDRGEIPFARGLAKREWVQKVLSTALLDPDPAKQLRAINGVSALIVDVGTVDVHAL